MTDDAIERLTPYTTRYGETLRIGVESVSGDDDHLALQIDLPPTLSLEKASDELRAATTRYLRGSLGLSTFAWAETGLTYASISAEADAEANEDDENDDVLPDWLRDSLKRE